MKNFINENWFKLGILIILLIIGIFYISSSLKTKQVNISSQENCSKKSEDLYLKNKDGVRAWLLSSDYTNHYNNKMNKCFVVISGGNKNTEYHSEIYDAYENTLLGSVHTNMDIASSCGLKNGNIYASCKSTSKEKGSFSAITEFENLIKPLMEN